MSTGPWPWAVLNLLGKIEQTVNDAIDENSALGEYSIGITVTSYDDHVATLYEEGWDFSTPKS